MVNKTALASAITTLGLTLGIASGQAVAQMSHPGMQSFESDRTSQFERIEQPLWLKGTVTVGGLGLIGLELWWFLLAKPQSRQATASGGIQEVTVTDNEKASALH